MANKSYQVLGDNPNFFIDSDTFFTGSETITYLGFMLGAAAIISNVITIRTFLAIGLEDGVTVSFFGLAVSDLLSSLAIIICYVGAAIQCYEYNNQHWITPFTPVLIQVFSIGVSVFIYLVTILTTTYIAVARCMCVARPLQFKHIFTKSRSVAIIVSFYLLAVCLETPVFVHTGRKLVFSAKHNVTRYGLWTSPKRNEIAMIVNMIAMTIIPFTAQIILITCTLILTYCLMKAATFRQSFSSTATMKAIGTVADEKSSNGPDVKLTGKDLQVVKQVVLISAVFIVCNLPSIGISVLGILEPSVSLAGRDIALYSLCHNGKRLFDLVNSSVNVLFYYRYNSKFRRYCKL